jgi:GNAT superfamily N-acetyltransferase
MKRIPLTMVREHLRDIPEAALPEGYTIRAWLEGDGPAWADIESRAGEFDSAADALGHFEREFGPFEEELRRRCFFVISPDERAVATTTAWYGDDLGERRGRIHWVAVVPEEQGKKLSKPLLSRAMTQLARLGHTSAYLTTQTTSWRAVNMYLKYGFVPLLRHEACREGWEMMERQLGRSVF